MNNPRAHSINVKPGGIAVIITDELLPTFTNVDEDGLLIFVRTADEAVQVLAHVSSEAPKTGLSLVPDDLSSLTPLPLPAAVSRTRR